MVLPPGRGFAPTKLSEVIHHLRQTPRVRKHRFQKLQDFIIHTLKND